ncbi:hypothetical protein D3C77_463960 [compost metagenome]
MDLDTQGLSLAIGKGFEQRDDNLLVRTQLKPLSVVGGIALAPAHQGLELTFRRADAGQQATGQCFFTHFHTHGVGPAGQPGQQPQGQAIAIKVSQTVLMQALYGPRENNLALIDACFFSQAHRHTAVTGLQ